MPNHLTDFSNSLHAAMKTSSVDDFIFNYSWVCKDAQEKKAIKSSS